MFKHAVSISPPGPLSLEFLEMQKQVYMEKQFEPPEAFQRNFPYFSFQTVVFKSTRQATVANCTGIYSGATLSRSVMLVP